MTLKDIAASSYYGSRLTYATPAALIGRHWWRCVVFRHDDFGLCTALEWMPDADHSHWRLAERWPTYDPNDGTHAGLPKTLKSLYARFRRQIDEALGRPVATADNNQLTLFA